MTLDGVFEDPGGAEGSKYGGWSLKFNDEGSMKFKFDELKAADALLLGRKTYEGFAKAWPTMRGTGEFGERMNGLPKYVVTQTLDKLDWQNSQALKGDLASEVTKLKEQPGQDILVAGSGTLVRALMKLGLVDEYHLLVYPVVLGSGRRLFEGADQTFLRLKDTKAFGESLVLTYEPACKKVMRKIALFMMVSLDGHFEGPGHDLGWHNVDDEFNALAVEQLDEADTLLFGRTTYDMMACFWPTEAGKKADPETATRMNKLPKIVFSHQNLKLKWENTRLVMANRLTDELTKLKNQSGKDLLALGSSSLCVTLLELGLLDELRLMVNPIILGTGTPLFSGLQEPARLALTKDRRFTSGNILFTYYPGSPAQDQAD